MTNDFRGPQRPKSDPLDTVSSFLTSFSNAFTEVFEEAFDKTPTASGFGAKFAARPGTLTFDVKFLEDGLVAKYDLPPGVNASDVQITLEGEILQVSVSRDPNDDSAADFSNRPTEFSSTVALDTDRHYEPVSAGIVNGVLEVALSSRQLPKRYTIPVTSTVTTR